MQKSLAILFALLFSFQYSSFSIGYDWYKVDTAGGMYTCKDLVSQGAYIYGVAEFATDSATLGGIAFTNSSSNGKTDLIVFKSDTSGNLIWAKKYGGIGNEQSNNLCIDAQGNVIVTGNFEGIGTFDNLTLTSTGGTDVFVLKLNTNGTTLWARNFGSSSDCNGVDVCTDFNNDIYVVSNTLDTFGFAGTTTVVDGTPYVSIAKYSSSGNEVWVRFTHGNYPFLQTNQPGYDHAIAIKYSPVDSTVVFLGSFGSKDPYIYNSSFYISSPILWSAKVVVGAINHNGVATLFETTSGTSQGNFGYDLAITDNSKIISSIKHRSLSFTTYSKMHYVDRNSQPNSYQLFVDNDPNGGIYPILTKIDTRDSLVYGIHTKQLGACPNYYSIMRHVLEANTTIGYSNNRTFYGSQKLTSIAYNGNEVFVGGDNYYAKICFSNCSIGTPLRILNPAPDVTKCNLETVPIGSNACNYFTGGIESYTYSWSPTIGLSDPDSLVTDCNVDTTTTYILTITDNLNNAVYDTVLVTVNNGSITNASLSSSADTACLGDSVLFIANYNGFIDSISWWHYSPTNQGFANNFPTDSALIKMGYINSYSHPPGTWTVRFSGKDTVTGCRVELSKTIELIANTTLSLATTNLNVCQGDSMNLSAVGNVSYGPWTRGLDTIASNNGYFVPNNNNYIGPYNIIGIDSNGCIGRLSTSINIILDDSKLDTIIGSKPGAICSSDSLDLLAFRTDRTYCNNFSTLTNGPWYIEKISIDSGKVLEQISGNGPGDYNLYTSYTSKLAADSTYQIELVRNNSSTSNPIFTKLVWIDFNQDGDFDDTLESVVSVMNSPNQSDTANIHVPSSAMNGPTRMRIAFNANFAAYPSLNPKCDSYFGGATGEIEDYEILIINGIEDSNYIWSPSTNLTNQYGLYTQIISNPSSNYTLTYIGDNCGVNRQINIYPSPNLSINAVPSSLSICYGDSITLTGMGLQTYNWTNPYANNIINGQPFLTPYLIGNRVFHVSGVDSNGCIVNDSITMQVNPNPQIGINNLLSNQPIGTCTGDSVLLFGSPLTQWSTPASNYTWTPAITDSVPFVPVISQLYKVVGTTAHGCTDSSSIYVQIDSNINANSIPNQNPLIICLGDSITLFGSGGGPYMWSGGAIDSIPFAPTSSQSFLIAAAQNGICSFFDSIQVIVNSLPNVSANSSLNQNPAQVCNGDTITLYGSGASTYSWTGGVNDSIAFIPISNQSYIVTATDTNNCSANDTIQVNVNSLPTVLANNPPNTIPYVICPPDSALIWGSGAQSYIWSGGIFDSLAFLPSMNQTYTVIGIDSNGCVNMDSIELNIATYPIDTLLSYPPFLCQGDSVALGAILNYCSPTVDSAGTGPHIERVAIKQNTTSLYSNSTGDGPGDYNIYIDSIKLNANTNYTLEIKRDTSTNGDTIKHRAAWIDYNRNGSFNDPGEQIVLSTNTNPQNIALNFLIPSSVANGYTVMRIGGSTNTPFGPCRLRNGEYEDYVVQIIGGQTIANQFTWSPVNQLIDTLGAIVTSTNLYAPTTFIVRYTDTNNCSFTDSIQVFPNPLPIPIITFSSDTLYCTNVNNISNYTWTLSGNTVGTNDSILVITQNGQYVVQVTDSGGCIGYDTIQVVNLSAGNLFSETNHITLYPNPSSGVFTIRSDIRLNGQVEIYDIVGKRISTFNMNAKSKAFDISGLANGDYIIRIITKDKSYITKLTLQE